MIPRLSYTLHQLILTQCKLLTIVLYITTNEIWQKAVFFRRWFAMLNDFGVMSRKFSTLSQKFLVDTVVINIYFLFVSP